jgi:glycosyltransferase involved in cell wall biosynthesis
MNTNDLVSVVIPTLGREEDLCETISYFLNEEDYRPFELIVIDQSDSHTPSTEKFLSLLNGRIVYKKAKYKNLPKARNEGAVLAKGDIVVYVDDDVRPRKGFLSAHVSPYSDPGVWGVAGAILGSSRERLLGKEEIGVEAYNKLMSQSEALFNVDFGYSVLWAVGNNMSFRKSVIARLGGFDENFRGIAAGEEAEFCHRIRLNGGIIHYTPYAVLVHKISPTGGVRSFDNKEYIKSTARCANYFFQKLNVSRSARYKNLWRTFRTRVANKKNILTGRVFIFSYFFFLGVLESHKYMKQLREKKPMMLPKITIITPSYNQGRFLEETILSVISQGYPNLEYIIMDGGSTDNSVGIIRNYEKHLSYWVSGKDGGQSDAINKALAKATGEIFGWLNSDDLYLPGTLRKVGEYFMAHPDCHFLTGDGEIFDAATGRPEHYIRAKDYSFSDLLRFYDDRYLPQPSVFFSREAFKRSGGLDAGLYYTMDLDLWLRMRRDFSLHYLPLCLARLRRHAGAKTQVDVGAAVEEVSKTIERYLPGVNNYERFIIRNGVVSARARAACRNGLEKYFNNCRNEAADSLRKAVGLNPAVLLSKEGLQLILRLALPGQIKRLIFTKP